MRSPIRAGDCFQASRVAERILNSVVFISIAIFMISIFQFKPEDQTLAYASHLHLHQNHHHHHHLSHKHQHSEDHQAASGENKSERSPRAVYLAFNDSRRPIPTNQNDPNNRQQNQMPAAYMNDQPPVLFECCSCMDAKYELIFEGLWSKYTHPDDFPENYWLAHFSDLFGASHSNEFRLWTPYDFASDGVKELAELGSTKGLEAELKLVKNHTRTLIKARELRYPTLNSKTSAVFRVDRRNHLVSVLSKLGPSPDWMVGVSGLELCQADCSWASQRIVNLYLWDAGTDSGTTFTADDLPTNPVERIQPFKKVFSAAQRQPTTGAAESSNQNGQTFSELQNYPTSDRELSNSQAPFADDQSKPFARLTITRQETYEKSCTDTNNTQAPHQLSTFPYQLPPSTAAPPSISDCRFADWSDWSTCTGTCGRGTRARVRSFIDDQAELLGCQRSDLKEVENCYNECVGSTVCVTSDWSNWSQCSVDCGEGLRKRTRSLIGFAKRACESVDLAENEVCMGDCSSDNSSCELTEWSAWSECSCDKAKSYRFRRYKSKESMNNCLARLRETKQCPTNLEHCKNGGHKGRQLAPNPNFPVIDCKYTYWGSWSSCDASCGIGNKTRIRYISQLPKNGGKPCDNKKLISKKKCKNLPPCAENSFNKQGNSWPPKPSKYGPARANGNHHGGQENLRSATTSTTPSSSMMDDEDDTEDKHQRQEDSPCEYGNWTQWSDCEVVCRPVKKGSNKIRQKLPLGGQNSGCQVVEELYYCDPNVYCYD